jgi:hypothetical protein
MPLDKFGDHVIEKVHRRRGFGVRDFLDNLSRYSLLRRAKQISGSVARIG